MAAVLLHERLIAGRGAAAEVGYSDRRTRQKRGGGHASHLGMRARRGNRKQHIEQRLAGGRANPLD